MVQMYEYSNIHLPPKGRTWCQKMVINWDLDNLSADQTSTGEWRYCKCTYCPGGRANPSQGMYSAPFYIRHSTQWSNDTDASNDAKDF